MSGVLVLSFLVGAIQALILDRWLPLSILAWQRQWARWQTALFATLGFLGHVGAGILLAILLVQGLGLNSFAVAGIAILIALLRILRDQRGTWAGQVLATGSQGHWGVWRVLTWMGPAEFILPLYNKFQAVDPSALPLMYGCFAAGAGLVGVGAVTLSQRLWDRPRWIVQTLHVPARGFSVASACAVSGLILFSLVK